MAFLNSLLLPFMALGSVPIIIHLLNKRRFRPVQWAAMEFLLQAIQQNSRRLQIRDLILMLIRTLAILCLCLALARPTLGSRINFLGAQSKTGAVILIDNSYSMGYHNGRETRFDAAKRLTKTILARLNKGAWCALYTFNDQVRSPLGDPSRNLGYIEQELDRFVHLSGGATSVEKALNRAEKLFRTHREFTAAHKELYIITDMQAKAWNPKNVSSSFAQRLQGLSEQASIYLVDVGDAGGENAAILEIEPSDRLVAVDMPVAFTVKLKNSGQAELQGLPVDFYVDPSGAPDQRPVERSAVDIGPGEVSTVSFETKFSSGGDHKVEVRLGPDRLAADNHRYATVEVIEETHFLLVDGRDQRAEDPLSSEVGYLRFALSPADLEHPDKQTVVQTETVPYYRLGEKNLADYQALALCNVEKLNRAAISVIRRQVFTGMGLMIFLGDQTDPLYYNQAFGEKGAKLLPAEILPPWGEAPKIGGKLPPFKSLGSDSDKISHPIMTPFNADAVKPLLANVKTYRAFGLKPLEGDDVQGVAYFDDGQPAIVERKVASGTVLLFAFPATTAWGSLPTQPSFPIMMLRAANRLSLGNRPAKNLPVGTPIRGYVSLADQKTRVRIQAPLPVGKRETHPEATGDGRAAFDFAETDQAGFYDVRLDRAGFKPMVYSLNGNAEVESDLTNVLPESLKMDYPGFKFIYVSKSEDLANRLLAEKQGTEIWPWFLFLVFALLLAESLLAKHWAPRD